MSSYRSSTFAIAVVAFAHCAMAGFVSAEPKADSKNDAAASTTAPAMTMETFLDRLMMAESGGNAFANNPRSTALGPFQFIAATWLEVVRAAFADATAKLKPHEILQLRTEPVFARQVATAYSQSNAAHLVANGAKATFANLRLAFLVGPSGAARVLSAKPDTPCRNTARAGGHQCQSLHVTNDCGGPHRAFGTGYRRRAWITSRHSMQTPSPSRPRSNAPVQRRRSPPRAISNGRAAASGSPSQRGGRHAVVSKPAEARPFENIRECISRTLSPPRLRHVGRRIC